MSFNLSILIIFIVVFFANCHTPVRSHQTSFFSQFSVRQLVALNKADYPLNCYSGTTAVGSGGTTKIFGTDIFNLSKTENYACVVEMGSIDQFDESGFLANMRQSVERELQNSGARFIEEGNNLGNDFTMRYQTTEMIGRVQIRGRKGEHNSYYLEAKVEEHPKDKAK